MSLLGIFDQCNARPWDGTNSPTDTRNSVQTSGTYIDTTFTTSALSLTAYNTYPTEHLYSDLTPAAYDASSTVYWLHFVTTMRAARPFPDSIGLYDGSGVPIWILRTNTTTSRGRIYFETFNDAGALVTSTLIRDESSGSYIQDNYDISIDPDNDEVKVYLDGAIDGTYSFDVSTHRTAATNIERLVLLSRATSSGTSVTSQCFSQVLFADEETIGWRVAQLQPNAAGSNADEGGVYTNIDENGFDTATFNTLTAAGLETFEYSDMPDLTALSLEVVEVVIGTAVEADVGATAPNVTNQMYASSTAYDLGSAVDATGLDYADPVVTRLATNPATATDWTESDLNNAEFGYKTTV